MCRLLLGLILLVGLSPAVCDAETSTHKAALERAANFLWSKQSDDGSWRSEYYGVMRSGQSLTPLVLHALMQSIDSLSSDEAGNARRAAQFIIEHLDAHGAVGRSDLDVLEYPVYSTAYAVESLQRIQTYRELLGPAGWEAIRRMQKFLISAQYQESHGFQPADAAYGSWGFNTPVRRGVVGHLDIAHTRKALTALQTWQDRDALQQAQARSKYFLLLMQKHRDATAQQPQPSSSRDDATAATFDGGFYFSPTALSANKALYDEEHQSWRSYATATCDGILALQAAGVEPSDPRLTAALEWLRRHADVDYPQGVPTDHPEPWGDAIRFYHYAVRAEVYRRFNFPATDKTQLVEAVIHRQQPDGSFVNTDSPLMKEDDPLVATALAVIALANCASP